MTRENPNCYGMQSNSLLIAARQYLIFKTQIFFIRDFLTSWRSITAEFGHALYGICQQVFVTKKEQWRFHFFCQSPDVIHQSYEIEFKHILDKKLELPTIRTEKRSQLAVEKESFLFKIFIF